MYKKKIIVVGATGYIGKHLIPALIKNQYKVTILARSIKNIKNFKWFSKINYINFTNFKVNLNKIEKNSTFVYLAWEGLPNYNSTDKLKKNVLINYKFKKELLKKKKIKNLIVTGTCQEYGMKKGLQKINEKTNPVTNYGLAKVRLYKKISNLEKSYTFNFKWLRLYYSYGKWQNKNSIFSQLRLSIRNKEKYFKMSKGDQMIDYLPISKMVKKILLVIEKKNNGIFNVCSGKPIMLKNLVKKYIKKRKSTTKLRLGYYSYLKYEPKYFWGENNI